MIGKFNVIIISSLFFTHFSFLLLHHFTHKQHIYHLPPTYILGCKIFFCFCFYLFFFYDNAKLFEPIEIAKMDSCRRSQIYWGQNLICCNCSLWCQFVVEGSLLTALTDIRMERWEKSEGLATPLWLLFYRSLWDFQLEKHISLKGKVLISWAFRLFDDLVRGYFKWYNGSLYCLPGTRVSLVSANFLFYVKISPGLVSIIYDILV